MTRRRNSWGSVRQLASGRFQARYRVAGVEHLAPCTFRTKRDADAFLATARADLERGTWIDPEAGKVPIAAYASHWLDERPQLRPRTRELYEAQLRRHILPTFGSMALRDLRRPAIRTWYASVLSGPRPGVSTAAKCYRLLRSILATAVEDELIAKNPSRSRVRASSTPRSARSQASSRYTRWPARSTLATARWS
jgi:hypothetical protein